MKINSKTFSSLNYRSVMVGVVMSISVLAFLFTGFGRVGFLNFKGMDPNLALIVGNQKVDMVEFSSVLTAQGYSNSMPENQKQYILSQVLNNLIHQKLLLEEAQKIGFTTSQNEIAAFIRSLPVFSDPTTKQFSMDRFKQYLTSQQMTEVEFFQKVQNELTMNGVTQLLFLPEVYPENVAKTQYLMNNTTFHLSYAVLALNPTFVEKEAEIKVEDFFKNADNLKELENRYQAQKSKYSQPSQYKVSSILISYKEAKLAQGEALSRNKFAAQKLVDGLLSQVQNGANFTSLASKTNDDLRALQNKGSLGFVDETSIDTTSYQALTKLSLDKPLSSVVDTPFGFRIFKLEEKKEGFTKSFDDVKKNLAKDILTQKLRMSLQNDFDNKVRAAIAHAPDVPSLDSLLATQGISWKTMEKPFTIQDSFIDEFGSAAVLSENIFSLKKPGDIIPKILDFGASKHVIVKLVSLRAPNDPSEADIKEMQKQKSDDDVQNFFQTYLANLKESYETKEKIKINPALMQGNQKG